MEKTRRRCTAKTSTSGYTERCKKPPILGGTVCGTHGGGAPQVKRSARQRLDDLVDPVISLMTKAIEKADARDGMELHPTIVRLSQMVLDRAGFKPINQVELLGLEDARIQVVQQHGSEIATIIGDVLRAAGIDTENPAIRVMLRGRLEAQTDGDVDRWRREHPPPEPEPEPERPAPRGVTADTPENEADEVTL